MPQRSDQSTSTRSYGASLIGIALLVAAMFCAEWTASAAIRWIAILLAVAVGTALYRRCRSSRTRSSQSGRTSGVVAVWSTTLLVTAALASLFLLLGWMAGSWHFGKPNWLDKSMQHWLTIKLPTVVVQQWILHLVLVPAILLITRSKQWTIVISAIIFAALHIPNPVLTLVTFVGALIWVALYLSQQRLAPLIVSHFALAVLVAAAGGEYLLNMRVGIACLDVMPIVIDTKERTVVVFPGSVTGNVIQVTQYQNELILEGWARDEIHHWLPTRFYALLNDRLIPLRRHSPRPVSKTFLAARQTSGRTDDIFRVSVSLNEVQHDQEIRVFARNRNGWFAELNRNGAIRPVPGLPRALPVTLYPTLVDGRIDRISLNHRSVRIGGWVRDLESESLSTELWVRTNGEWFNLDLSGNRVHRKDIHKKTGAASAEKCGFDIVLPDIEPREFRGLAAIACSADGLFSRIQLTPRATRRLSTYQAARDVSPAPGGTIQR